MCHLHANLQNDNLYQFIFIISCPLEYIHWNCIFISVTLYIIPVYQPSTRSTAGKSCAPRLSGGFLFVVLGVGLPDVYQGDFLSEKPTGFSPFFMFWARFRACKGRYAILEMCVQVLALGMVLTVGLGNVNGDLIYWSPQSSGIVIGFMPRSPSKFRYRR